MRRFLSSKSLYVGQLVVTADAVNSTVCTIAEIDTVTSRVILQWMDNNRFISEGYPSYMLKKPTLEQVEWSIVNRGPLISSEQIIHWA